MRLFVLLVVTAVVAGCTGRSESPPPTQAATDVPAAASSPTPTPPLTGEEILRRSDEAMRTRAVLTESLSWDVRDGVPSGDAPVVAYQHLLRAVPLSGGVFDECRERTRPFDLFARRSEGGLPFGVGSLTGTAPEQVELLGETETQGVAAWLVRYRFERASYEGPIPTERTEWIATDDFRLLRAEVEQVDNYGLIGQTVTIFRYEAVSPECGRQAEATIAELRPISSPRLASATQ